MTFLWKIVPYWVYFGQDEDFELTTELTEKVQYSHNQAIKNGLNEAILLMWIMVGEIVQNSQSLYSMLLLLFTNIFNNN